MKQVLGKVTANITIGPGSHLLRVQAPGIARHAQPGQFVHVRCSSGWDPLLRRPISIARFWDAGGQMDSSSSREEFALLVEEVGRGSALLCSARVGDQLDLVGPLGHGFALDHKARHILLLAGGVGIAPLLALASDALDRDLTVTMLFGARTAARVFPATLVPPEVEYIVHTDDGSFGRAGLVVQAIPEYIPMADQLFACGPTPMLRALAESLRGMSWGARAASPPLIQVSLEQHMGCAMGACYGCVVDTSAGLQRVCRDGPVFDIRALSW